MSATTTRTDAVATARDFEGDLGDLYEVVKYAMQDFDEAVFTDNREDIVRILTWVFETAHAAPVDTTDFLAGAMAWAAFYVVDTAGGWVE